MGAYTFLCVLMCLYRSLCVLMDSNVFLRVLIGHDLWLALVEIFVVHEIYAIKYNFLTQNWNFSTKTRSFPKVFFHCIVLG